MANLFDGMRKLGTYERAVELSHKSRDENVPVVERMIALYELSYIGSDASLEAAKIEAEKMKTPVYKFVRGARVRVDKP